MNIRYISAAFLLTLSALAVGALTLRGAGAAQADPTPTPTPIPTPQTSGVRWAFYVTYNSNSWLSLQSRANQLTHVSPWFFYVGKDGQVTGRDQPQASAVIRQAGAKSLPMVQNTVQYNEFTAILTDTNKQIAIVDQLDALVMFHGYDGITIDFEGVNGADRPFLTAFMSRLYERFRPKGKLVAMAVAAKTKEVNTGWAGSYDYEALAAVTDYIFIMAYDYHWSTGEPGPVAPMPRLQETARYAVTKIPPQKIIWGVGVYGYDWAVDKAGKSIGKSDYRHYNEAALLARSPGAQSGYDEATQAPWVRYTIHGQQRVLWYEDRDSFNAKLDLINQYGMAGFGIWRLGQEDPRIWGGEATATPPRAFTPRPILTSTPTPRVTATPTPTSTPTATPLVMATATPTPPAACLPVSPVASTSDTVYFPQTRHTLRGIFLRYWREHGGLPVYGYPITEEFIEASPTDGKLYRVQYFERNRFEYHPENLPPNDVQLGLLGVQAVAGRVFPTAEPPPLNPDILYFPQVKRSLTSLFLRYWQSHGGLAQFGYPISEPVMERSDVDGKTYLVQYFERNRFELHPEYAGTEAEVLLGLLGVNASPCK